MNGETEKDIAEAFGDTKRNICQILDTICLKIKEVNDENWLSTTYLNNIREANWDYKKCTRCEVFYPATGKYFSPNKQGKQGFLSICKKCR